MLQNPYATPVTRRSTDQKTATEQRERWLDFRDYGLAMAGGLYLIALYIALVAEHAYYIRLVAYREFITISDWWAAWENLGAQPFFKHYLPLYTKLAIAGAIVAICLPVIDRKLRARIPAVFIWLYLSFLMLDKGWLGLILAPFVPIALLLGDFGLDGESLADGFGQLIAVGFWVYPVAVLSFIDFIYKRRSSSEST